LLPDGLIDGLRENADQRRERLRSQRADQFSFVAEDAGEVAGYALGGSERTGDAEYRGEVYAIYVLPAHQGKGLGRALIRESARELARRGLDSLVIWVLRENEVGRGFYERLGGRAIARRTGARSSVSNATRSSAYFGRITASFRCRPRTRRAKYAARSQLPPRAAYAHFHQATPTEAMISPVPGRSSAT